MVRQGQLIAAFPGSTDRARSRRWVLGFALVVMLLTTLPYLLGYAFQGQDWRFTGFVFAVEDGNSYIAKMQSGAAGAWLFRTPYTAFPQGGVVAFLPYLVLGKLASPPGLHEQLVVLFHLFRFVAGCLAILATYDFIAHFTKVERYRRYGLALATLGGGLGWILLLLGRDTWLGSLPLEFYSPETFGFLEYYGFPHLALARAATLWGLLIYLKSTSAEGEADWRKAVGMGCLWLLAALCQPLTALVMGAVIGLHIVALAGRNMWLKYRRRGVDWHVLRNTLLFAAKGFIIPAPFLVYSALAFNIDPYLKSWTSQNLILSPPLPHYLLAYGVLLPFLPFGARNLLRQNPREGWLLVAWLLASPLLAYAPVNLQRRLVEGVWVAMVVVALWSIRGESLRGVRWRAFLYTTLLAFPSTFILIAGGMIAAVQPRLPIFRSAEEVAVFEHLRERAAPGSVVISSYETGNALPAWAPVRVVVGHGPESADLDILLPQVRRFYTDTTTDLERAQLLNEHDISFIFHGPHEEDLGSWDPATSTYLDTGQQGWSAIKNGYGVYEVSE